MRWTGCWRATRPAGCAPSTTPTTTRRSRSARRVAGAAMLGRLWNETVCWISCMHTLCRTDNGRKGVGLEPTLHLHRATTCFRVLQPTPGFNELTVAQRLLALVSHRSLQSVLLLLRRRSSFRHRTAALESHGNRTLNNPFSRCAFFPAGGAGHPMLSYFSTLQTNL